MLESRITSSSSSNGINVVQSRILSWLDSNRVLLVVTLLPHAIIEKLCKKPKKLKRPVE